MCYVPFSQKQFANYQNYVSMVKERIALMGPSEYKVPREGSDSRLGSSVVKAPEV